MTSTGIDSILEICPNNPNKQYLVSDTKGNRVIIMNKDYKISNIIQNNFDWVQDAIFVSDGNVLVADSNNGRIVHWDKENQLYSEVYSYNTGQRRIGSIIEISKKTLSAFLTLLEKVCKKIYIYYNDNMLHIVIVNLDYKLCLKNHQ